MADVQLLTVSGATRRCCHNYVVATSLIHYFIYVESTGSTLVYRKSTDGGATWASAVTISTQTPFVSLDVWFDKWTPGDSGTLIHIWYIDSTNDDIFWRTLDTSSDTLGTEQIAFAGASAVAGRGCFLAGTKTRSGYLYCAFDIDAGAERGLVRSTNGGSVWSANLSTTFVEATIDECMLFPASNTGDDNDCWAIYQDADADALTIKMWDSSAAAQVESATVQTMAENVTDLTGQRGFSGAVRFSDGHLIVVSCSEYDTATADMQAWDVSAVNAGSSTGITALTNITTDIDDNYHPNVFIDQNTNNIYVAYNGKRDGSETLGTTTKAYYCKSTDGGTSWSSGDTAYMEAAAGNLTRITAPPTGARFAFVFQMGASYYANFVNSVDLSGPLTKSLTGALSFVGADMIRTGKAMTAALSFAGANVKLAARRLTAALSFIGALTGMRLLVRTLTATLSFIGARKSATGKALAGSLAFIGAQSDRTAKVFTAALSFIGLAAKRGTRALSGALSFVGATAKRGARSFSGALSFTGTIRRSIGHQMAAALAFIGSFATQFAGGAIQYTKALVASLSFVGAQTKLTRKPVAAAVNFVGTIAKAIPRTFSAALNFVGTFTKAFPRIFTAALSFVGTQSDRTAKVFAGALSFVGAISKTWARTFAAALAFVGSFKKSSGKAISGALAFSGTIKRAIAHKMAAALAFAGNFITQVVGGPVHYLQTLTAAILFSGTARRGTAHKMAGALSFLGGVGRRFPRALAGALAFVGALARRNVLNKLLTASLSFIGTQTKAARKALAGAALAFVGVFTKFVPGLALIFRNRRASRGIGI